MYLKVLTTDFLPDGSRRYMNVETEHDDIDAFTRDLRAGPIVVCQLKAHLEDDTMVVTKSRRVLINSSMVASALEADIAFRWAR